MTILQGVRLEENKRDRWMWKLEGEGLYSVNSAYVFLQEQYLEDPDPGFTWIWEAPAPSNIKAFAWRMLLGRIQTRDNLHKRQILHIAEEAVCPLCGVVEESCAHLLFSCPETLSIWYACSDWLGVLTAQVPEPKAHLLQFPSVGRSKAQKLGEIAIWLATIWTIWCQRNKVVFNGGSLVREQVVEHIKLMLLDVLYELWKLMIGSRRDHETACICGTQGCFRLLELAVVHVGRMIGLSGFIQGEGPGSI
ncbi:uncharacterized protein LOC130737084 [Lotus japonicus]|uniref:uncharacterized protein LOC130737084 n=1 Tax=Lotus japonicus TaxID=34305 RepID=UPI00258B895E|nr:uncharacterized protein LOC130737084 [Lotus japonicus]